MSLWTNLGYSQEEIETIENFDDSGEWGDEAEQLYIESGRCAYRSAFYQYLNENGEYFE